MDLTLMFLDEMKEYGIVLADLIKNNKIRLIDNPDNSEYLMGKIDAYEVAYEDYIRRLKKVNSYTSRAKKDDKVAVQSNGERWILK